MLAKLQNIYQEKKFDIKVFVSVLTIALGIFVFSDILSSQKTKIIFDDKYTLYAEQMHSQIENIIENKKAITLTIALALAKETHMKEVLQNNTLSLIDLKEFSNKLKENMQFQNVWFHIIDTNGTSLYRSWSNQTGDNVLNVRPDVKKILLDPTKTISTISVGKFGLTFKSIIPIVDQEKFLGIFEMITHFDSIINKLSQKNIQTIVLVNKVYSTQISQPFTNTFLKEYYVANADVDQTQLDYIEKKGIEKFFHYNEPYFLDETQGKFITFYPIHDIQGNKMATLIAFNDIKSINVDEVKVFKRNSIIYTLLCIFILVSIGYFFVVREYARKLKNNVFLRTKELNNEKNYIQTILDSNVSMIFVIKRKELVRANKTFLDFFGVKGLQEFQEKYTDIGNFFVLLNEQPFPKTHTIKNDFWAHYLSEHKQKGNLVKLKFENSFYFFTLNASNMHIDNEVLINMQNITEIREKEDLFYEQSKLASLGDMLGNIAHQWRQPLSIISTVSTGMICKKEYSVLTDEDLLKSCESININAQYLSKTIDDFRNFIQGDSVKLQFDLEKQLNQFLTIVDASIHKYHIKVIVDLAEKTKIEGYPSELTQCFINIFNNAKDALVENTEETNRYVFITQTIQNNQVTIEFKDNAKGIKKSIISNVFEPYFTTKHRSQGTGLGLHMTYNLIVNAMKGKIQASNVEYTYKNQIYTGASFKIILPSKTDEII